MIDSPLQPGGLYSDSVTAELKPRHWWQDQFNFCLSMTIIIMVVLIMVILYLILGIFTT